MTQGIQIPGLLCLLAVLRFTAPAGVYYVSTTGSDSNPGTLDKPFLTISKAMSLSSTVFRPGDTIFVRGGRYQTGATITISKTGADSARYRLFAYPGERPLLDFSGMAFGSSNRGVNLSGRYWHVRGIDVLGAGDNGMHISGSYNTVEFCSFADNRDTGLQLSNGASYNRIINCDSYGNADPGHGNADGFAPKLDVGSGNSFAGCRAWQNSDDGWDGYMRGADDVTTTLDNCWCFNNGYLRDGSPSAGNGNGYKLGGSDLKDLKHNFVLRNCLSFDNRVKGYDQNNNRGSMTLINCTGYRDSLRNYSIGDTVAPGKLVTVKNCLSLGPYGSLHARTVQQTNSWMGFTVTPADFISIDTAGVRGPRKPDGSLPEITFMHLVSGSPLVDAGTDVGLPFSGTAPDLGAFESKGTVAVVNTGGRPGGFRLYPCYPNPFNPATTITFGIPQRGEVELRIIDICGRLVRELAGGLHNHGTHTLRWDGNNQSGAPAASGIYFARLNYGNNVQTTRLILTR